MGVEVGSKLVKRPGPDLLTRLESEGKLSEKEVSYRKKRNAPGSGKKDGAKEVDMCMACSGMKNGALPDPFLVQ